jgi:hypothetical protein
VEESGTTGEGAGGVALSGVAGVVCAAVAVVAGVCCGVAIAAPNGVDPAGAGSESAGLSLSSSGVTGREG